MPEIVEITITYAAAEQADEAARALLEARLAACVHVAGPVTSYFRWDGAVQVEPEWRLTAKTRPDLAAEVTERLTDAHPYDLPGVTLHHCETTPEFADWVTAETSA